MVTFSKALILQEALKTESVSHLTAFLLCAWMKSPRHHEREMLLCRHGLQTASPDRENPCLEFSLQYKGMLLGWRLKPCVRCVFKELLVHLKQEMETSPQPEGVRTGCFWRGGGDESLLQLGKEEADHGV